MKKEWEKLWYINEYKWRWRWFEEENWEEIQVIERRAKYMECSRLLVTEAVNKKVSKQSIRVNIEDSLRLEEIEKGGREKRELE